MRYVLIVLLFLASPDFINAQRQYANSSVLSSGNWYKISVSREGVYKLDGSMLASMGIQLPIPSGNIRLFGNGGQMLPEANQDKRPDDLLENAIWVSDGGDNSIESADYILFYAPGPHSWIREPSGNYRFLKNLYTDSAPLFY
jgi:hypothetical protein